MPKFILSSDLDFFTFQLQFSNSLEPLTFESNARDAATLLYCYRETTQSECMLVIGNLAGTQAVQFKLPDAELVTERVYEACQDVWEIEQELEQ